MNQTKPSILVVDDESSIRESFALILESDYNVISAGSGASALKKAVDQKIDLVFLDIRMPGMDGIETLSHLKKVAPQSEVIMVTAVQDVQKAALAIRYGARDYIVKPFDVEVIIALASEVIYKKNLLKVAGFAGEEPPFLIGGGDKIKMVKEQIKELAATDKSVLIVAEDGCEKEKVARIIHYKKRNTSQGFRAINALEISERELFGSREGKSAEEIVHLSGLLEDVQTIFIDHIEELDNSFIEKLRDIGDGIRVIAASNIDLGLEGFEKISLPPLRDRVGDLVELLQFYRVFYNDFYKLKTSLFSDDALAILSLYSFPGNVDELKSIISTAVLNQKEGEINKSNLPLYVFMDKNNFKPQSFEDIYSGFEKEFIESVLKKTDSNHEKAAALLNVKLHVLESKL